MRTIPFISISTLFLASIALSGLYPKVMSENKFLIDFVNHEYINVLTVIVTVSLVSVIQIHLEYTRIERKFKMRVFADARKKVNTSALVLVSILVLAFVLSFFRAWFLQNDAAISIIHCVALLTVLEGVFVMYDLVQTVYVMASDEPIEGEDYDEPTGR